MDKAALDSFATYAKEKGLSQEHAQLMIDRDHQERAALLKAGNDAMAAEDVRWKAELQSDKEFGGEKFGENAELVKRLFDVGDPDGVFRKGLDDAKLGNNVLLNRFMLRLARKFGIGEDKLAGRGGGEPAPKEPVENRLYPTMREKK